MLPIESVRWETPPHHLELHPDQVHVWRVRLDGVENEDDQLWKLLSRLERERAQRFHFDQHRYRFLRSHGVCRMILSRYTGIAPDELRLDTTPLGKPFLLGADLLDLRFNLSHSGDWMMVGVACGRELGVDVELLARNIDWQSIAKDYFLTSEIKAIQSFRGEDEQTAAFFRVWTVKEAYLKAVGKGLSGGLDRAVVQIGHGLPGRFVELPGGENELRHWQVFSFQPASGAVSAAVVAKDDKNLQLIPYHWNGLGIMPA
jgi:4'-phosphopantetheinyl transferase